MKEKTESGYKEFKKRRKENRLKRIVPLLIIVLVLAVSNGRTQVNFFDDFDSFDPCLYKYAESQSNYNFEVVGGQLRIWKPAGGSSGLTGGQYISKYELVGDFDNSSEINISDLTGHVAWLFKGGGGPSCLNNVDVDGSCEINISDLTYRVAYTFKGGPATVCGCVE